MRRFAHTPVDHAIEVGGDPILLPLIRDPLIQVVRDGHSAMRPHCAAARITQKTGRGLRGSWLWQRTMIVRPRAEPAKIGDMTLQIVRDPCLDLPQLPAPQCRIGAINPAETTLEC